LAAEIAKEAETAGRLRQAAGVLGKAGNVADVVENGLAIIDFVDDPSGKTGYAVVKTGVGTYLMGLGPYGWAVKFIAIPTLEWGFGTEEGNRVLMQQEDARVRHRLTRAGFGVAN
jgi:hypothetical protein